MAALVAADSGKTLFQVTTDKILPDNIGYDRPEIAVGIGVSLRINPLKLLVMILEFKSQVQPDRIALCSRYDQIHVVILRAKGDKNTHCQKGTYGPFANGLGRTGQATSVVRQI